MRLKKNNLPWDKLSTPPPKKVKIKNENKCYFGLHKTEHGIRISTRSPVSQILMLEVPFSVTYFSVMLYRFFTYQFCTYQFVPSNVFVRYSPATYPDVSSPQKSFFLVGTWLTLSCPSMRNIYGTPAWMNLICPDVNSWGLNHQSVKA